MRTTFERRNLAVIETMCVSVARCGIFPEGNLVMPKMYKRGDHVAWNSEAGRVSGVILKKVTSDVKIKGYVHHASKDEPQYLIKSDKTDHVAVHKGPALRLLKRGKKASVRKSRGKHR